MQIKEFHQSPHAVSFTFDFPTTPSKSIPQIKQKLENAASPPTLTRQEIENKLKRADEKRKERIIQNMHSIKEKEETQRIKVYKRKDERVRAIRERIMGKVEREQSGAEERRKRNQEDKLKKVEEHNKRVL